MNKIVIATRGSQLALWQAEHIKSRLQGLQPGLEVGLLVLKTKGDIMLDVPLAKVGGKGLFVKEIEDALLRGEAHVAVHSMKDVPMELPEGLQLTAIPQREICQDVFLSHHYAQLMDLSQGAILGTSSLRRQAQVLALRPDLQIKMLRGNVGSRLRKLEEGQFDAIILAGAGLKRLGLSVPYHEDLDPPAFLPAAGQGALGVESRTDSMELNSLLIQLDHGPTRICVEAERAFLAQLNGGCQVPIAAHATLHCDVGQASKVQMNMECLVAEPDGTVLLREKGNLVLADMQEGKSSPAQCGQARKFGQQLALALLDRGAKDILTRLYSQEA